jgi:hypothetical protein
MRTFLAAILISMFLVFTTWLAFNAAGFAYHYEHQRAQQHYKLMQDSLKKREQQLFFFNLNPGKALRVS